MCLPAENALGFCEEILEKDGYPAWVIGRVVEGEKKAYIAEEVAIAEVQPNAAGFMGSGFYVGDCIWSLSKAI